MTRPSLEQAPPTIQELQLIRMLVRVIECLPPRQREYVTMQVYQMLA